MSKRQRPDYIVAKQPWKRQRQSSAQNTFMIARRLNTVKRTYPGSLVPLRSGGYVPNTHEKKVADLDNATYQANTTGSITLLACPILGSDMTNRIGRKINLKSVYIRGFVASEASINNSSLVVPSQQARFILFIDDQPNGAAPAVTDLLKQANVTSQLNLNNRDRFKILKDKTFVFDPYVYNSAATTSVISANNMVKNFKCYKRLNVETVFNAMNGGTVADITSGALYMLWIGSVVASGGDVNASLTTRVRYLDQ